MARLDLPTQFTRQVERADLRLDRSNEVVHRVRSGAVSVYEFGETKWLMDYDVAVEQGDDGRIIEAVIGELQSADNWADFPIFREDGFPAGSTFNNPTITGGSAAAGYTLSGPLATLAGGGNYVPAVGEYVRGINNRLFQISARSSDGLTVTLFPRVDMATGTRVFLTLSMTGYIVPGSVVALPRSADWFGPWNFTVEERLI